MSHTRLLFHCITATRRREALLRREVRERVWRYLAGICSNKETHLIIAGGVEDHLHALVELPPTISVAEFMRDAKSNTSRFIHETWPDLSRFAWQESYAAFTVSVSSLAAVRRYIENQEAHHRTLSFMEEVRLLHERHGVTWDPRRFDEA